MKTAIITGITGQDGAYLAQLLVEKNYCVIGIHREGDGNDFYRLEYLGVRDKIELLGCNLLDPKACTELLRSFAPDEIYNLVAQSSVSYSFSKPHETIEFNIMTVLNLLEAIRSVDTNIKYYQASSSEMFGKIESLPISTHTQLHPISPYGISKAAGHWMVSQYREAYGLFAISGILFNHESYLRTDSFFVKKVIKAAIRISRGLQTTLALGNIDIKRDFGHAKEYVKAIWMMMQLDQPTDFQVCSGTSVSLRQIAFYVFDQLNVDHERIVIDPALFRPAEIKDIYGDKSEVEKQTEWKYTLTFFEVLDMLIKEELANDPYEA